MSDSRGRDGCREGSDGTSLHGCQGCRGDTACGAFFLDPWISVFANPHRQAGYKYNNGTAFLS